MSKNKQTNLSNFNESFPNEESRKIFNNPLGQLLYLDYEIKDLKNRDLPFSLEKTINKRKLLITIIEEIDNPSLKNLLTTYYIDKTENTFIENTFKKLKSRNCKKIFLSDADVKKAQIAQKQISKVLNNQLILTDKDLEILISDLYDSLDRIIIRKLLFDKKNQAQIAREINVNTFRRASSTQSGKSTFHRSTVSKRIKNLKYTIQ